ncbi:MAG: addiction module protein [bacterium]
MTVADEARLLEAVWQSLCSNPGEVESPVWHDDVLKTRHERLGHGQTTISPWLEANARLLKIGG